MLHSETFLIAKILLPDEVYLLAFCLEVSKQRMERKRTIMKLSKFRRLVSLMCVVSMMCVIVAPAAAAANYDDQISPHFISCPECRIGDLERIEITHNLYDTSRTVGSCSDGTHYFAASSGSGWECNRCSALVDMVYKNPGHFCTGKGVHYCLGRCTC